MADGPLFFKGEIAQMKKYNVKFVREFEVEVEAVSTGAATAIAERIMAQFAPGSCKLLSVVAEGVEVEVVAELGLGSGRAPPPRGGKPNGGGTPGTPVVRTEVLVDQIAEAA